MAAVSSPDRWGALAPDENRAEMERYHQELSKLKGFDLDGTPLHVEPTNSVDNRVRDFIAQSGFFKNFSIYCGVGLACARQKQLEWAAYRHRIVPLLIGGAAQTVDEAMARVRRVETLLVEESNVIIHLQAAELAHRFFLAYLPLWQRCLFAIGSYFGSKQAPVQLPKRLGEHFTIRGPDLCRDGDITVQWETVGQLVLGGSTSRVTNVITLTNRSGGSICSFVPVMGPEMPLQSIDAEGRTSITTTRRLKIEDLKCTSVSEQDATVAKAMRVIMALFIGAGSSVTELEVVPPQNGLGSNFATKLNSEYGFDIGRAERVYLNKKTGLGFDTAFIRHETDVRTMVTYERPAHLRGGQTWELQGLPVIDASFLSPSR